MKKSLAILGIGAFIALSYSHLDVKGYVAPDVKNLKPKGSYTIDLSKGVCDKETLIESYVTKHANKNFNDDVSIMKYSVGGKVYMYSIEETVYLHAIIDTDGDGIFDTKIEGDKLVNMLMLKKDLVPDWVKNKENCK